MAFIMSIKQWEFVQNSLDGLRERQAAVEEEHGRTNCGDCILCCSIQAPTVSILDCFWAVQGIKKAGLWELMKPRLKQWLSVNAHFGLGVEAGGTKQLLRRPCPFLGQRGCTIHGSHPMVCRSYNFVRPGGPGCGLRMRPGLMSSSAKELVGFYMDARKKAEELFLNGSTASIVLLPAGVYTLMCKPEEIEEQIQNGELCGDNFQLLKRADDKELHTFIRTRI